MADNDDAPPVVMVTPYHRLANLLVISAPAMVKTPDDVYNEAYAKMISPHQFGLTFDHVDSTGDKIADSLKIASFSSSRRAARCAPPPPAQPS